MGGGAFTKLSPPIQPVRIDSKEYFEIRSHYVSGLQSLYRHVASPIEGPSKSDHGDIDILVRGFRPYSSDSIGSKIPGDSTEATNTTDELLNSDIGPHIPAIDGILRSTAHVHTRRSPTVSFALALPTPFVKTHMLSQTSKDDDMSDPTPYVQVDITLVPDEPPELFTWNLLLNSYGDLWNILSVPMAKVGLVVTPTGLFMVSSTIQQLGHKRGRLLLTQKAEEILDFVGLNRLSFLQPTQEKKGKQIEYALKEGDAKRKARTADELFSDITESRFFDLEAYQGRLSHRNKSNDRQRYARPLFMKFLQEWLPKIEGERGTKRKRVPSENSFDDHDVATSTPFEPHPLPSVEQPCLSSGLSRDEVIELALSSFKKLDEWTEMHRAYRKELEVTQQRQWAKGLKREAEMQWGGYIKAWLDCLGMIELREEVGGKLRYVWESPS